jgi:hypothetical protein
MKVINHAQATSTHPEHWVESLYSLLARFPELGAEPDISGMAEDELQGLYRFLLRKAQSGE